MPRLNVVDPANATDKTKELFEGPLKGKHFNIFKGLANAPAALNAYVQLSGAVSGGSLSAAQREIIQLTAASLNSCDYCAAAHTAIGKQAGLTEQQTIQARNGTLDDPKLAALSKLTTALYEKKGFLSDEDLASFKSAGYDDGHVAEVVANYALALYTNYFNHVNDTVNDFPAAPEA